jgi:hypothetical protein
LYVIVSQGVGVALRLSVGVYQDVVKLMVPTSSTAVTQLEISELVLFSDGLVSCHDDQM